MAKLIFKHPFASSFRVLPNLEGAKTERDILAAVAKRIVRVIASAGEILDVDDRAVNQVLQAKTITGEAVAVKYTKKLADEMAADQTAEHHFTKRVEDLVAEARAGAALLNGKNKTKDRNLAALAQKAVDDLEGLKSGALRDPVLAGRLSEHGFAELLPKKAG